MMLNLLVSICTLDKSFFLLTLYVDLRLLIFNLKTSSIKTQITFHFSFFFFTFFIALICRSSGWLTFSPKPTKVNCRKENFVWEGEREREREKKYYTWKSLLRSIRCAHFHSSHEILQLITFQLESFRFS